jgi:hypothetical protein
VNFYCEIELWYSILLFGGSLKILIFSVCKVFTVTEAYIVELNTGVTYFLYGFCFGETYVGTWA